MTDVASEFDIQIEQLDGFSFRARFDKPEFKELMLDEPPPLGHDAAPNAARILAAAIGNCLAASLVFCLQRAKVQTTGTTAAVHVEVVRNESRRLRIGKVTVRLKPGVAPEAASAVPQCLSMFEDFCMVTQSVRQGIHVETIIELPKSIPANSTQ